MTQPASAPAERYRLFGRGMAWLIAAVWLFFLWNPANDAWHQPSAPTRYLSLAALVAFAVLYVYCFSMARRLRQLARKPSARRTWVLLGLMIVLGLLVVPGAGPSAMSCAVYVAAAAIFLLPLRAAVVVAGGMFAVSLVVPLTVAGWESQETVSFAVLMASFAIYGVSRMVDRNSELLAAHTEIRRLAVAQERARAARDLHDILGHSLTVITVKAELAGRLIEIDPARAAGEVGDLERLAREALADVRRTVGAYRGVSLAEELASARSALAAAGIAAELPGTVPDLPPERNELFGWAVREGVTNVVRHSGARRCALRVTPELVEVRDDGRGPVAADGVGGVGGHGLRGLRERVDQFGGQLSVGRAGPRGGFVLRVNVPDGTDSAGHREADRREAGPREAGPREADRREPAGGAREPDVAGGGAREPSAAGS
ncbi:sensor histidine kinase [Plantactinospora sp. KBS50]|uniref:sensor histidine kinase n=1 Tax=Plantactinospora sp. KBS50 TaxID=2024580 RepID=UPI0012FD561B|nr:histidine kinase [Plantactinospora sp. KBS50]